MDSKLIEVDDKQVLELLARLHRKIADMRLIMHEVGVEIVHSVEENFDAEGRYSVVGSYLGGGKKWDKLSDATIKIKEKQGKSAPYKILQDSGRLAGSISVAAIRADVNSVTVGTNVSYAAMHQFGAEKGEYGTAVLRINEHSRLSRKGAKHTVKSHERKVPNPMNRVPARPFLTVHPDNLQNIVDTLTGYLLDDTK